MGVMTMTAAEAANERSVGVADGSREIPGSGTRSRLDLHALLARWGVIAGFIAMVIFFAAMRPDTFATWQNARSIINASPILIIFGCIVTATMVLGEFDISFPNLADLSSIVIAVLVTTGGLSAGVELMFAVALDRKSTRLNSSHSSVSRMPSSA